MSRSNAAAAILFLLDDDDLRAVQWMRGLAEKDRQEALQLGETYLENRKKYGYPTWFEWSIATWGTKWNAYNQSFEEPNILWFDTAWNGVPQLIQNFPKYFRMWNFITPMQTKT